MTHSRKTAPLPVALLIVLSFVGGCSSDETTNGTTAAPATTTPATTLAPTTTAAATTTTPSTTLEPTTTTAAATVACPIFTDTDVQADGFPGLLSGLVGADVRTGTQPCAERFVLELQGTGDFPGWWVRYQAPPIIDDPRGEPVDVAGSAFIVVTVESWMTNPDNEGYHGPTRITPTNVSHIEELVMLGNFEGVTLWAIGVDQQRPFKVTTLTDPPRLVIDIASS